MYIKGHIFGMEMSQRIYYFISHFTKNVDFSFQGLLTNTHITVQPKVELDFFFFFFASCLPEWQKITFWFKKKMDMLLKTILS